MDKKNKFSWMMQLGNRNFGLLVLGIIFIVGIFLRTYHFHDLLRFNADQSRDARIVTEMVEGKAPLLILGPQAGGTKFRLGPAFYYFQYAAGKIFGVRPDRLAYPDLLFSVLAIGVVFLFLRNYFSQNLSLAISALAAVSAFAVKYSRFAWNPNSASFFVPLFLLALYRLGGEKNRNRILWAIVGGVALGICVQLHTVLLIALPLLTLLFFGYLWKNKISVLKPLAFLILMAVAVNIPQIAYEIKNKGENTQAFFQGVGTKSDKNSSFSLSSIGSNLAENFLCNAQGNFYAISALGSSDQCGANETQKIFSKKGGFVGRVEFSLGLIFSLGGYFLLGYYFKKETDVEKKRWLFLLILYSGLFFGIFFLVAEEISLRFYLMLFLVPLSLLGFWAKFILEKVPRAFYFASLLFLCLILLNLKTVQETFAINSNDFENATLGEVEFLADFMVDNSSSSGVAYLKGNSKYLFKSLKSTQFLAQKKKLKVEEFDKKKNLEPEDSFYYLSAAGSEPPKNVGEVEKESTYGHFTVFKVESL